MSASFIGSALVSTSSKAFKKLANKIVVNTIHQEMYSHQTVEKIEGEIKEGLVLKLFPLLQGHKESFLALPGSSLDCETKVDVVSVFTDATFAFQVKSSERAAIAHMGKACFLNGNKINSPGVVWVERGTHPLVVLKTLSTFLNQPINEEVLSCLTIARQFKGKVLPVKTFKFSPLQLHALGLLNVAKVEGANIRF